MKLEASKQGFVIYASNDDITLVGGFRSGSSPSGTTRLKFEIYSNSIASHIEKTQPDIDEKDLFKAAKLGVCELFVKDGTLFEFDTLVNLEITKKRKGYGTKVIQALRNTVDGDLVVRDIQPGRAAKFWKAQGVNFERKINNLGSKAEFQGGVSGVIPKEYVAKEHKKESSMEL